MYTLTLNKQKYKPNPFFGTVGGVLMIPAFALTIVALVVLIVLILPGFLIAMIGAIKIEG